MKTERKMFNLSEISAAWSGERIAELRDPIARGLNALRKRFEDTEVLLIEFVLEFDYDGPCDYIGQMLGFASSEKAKSALPTLVDRACKQALAEHPTWTAFDLDSHGMNVIAYAIGTSKNVPSQIGGFAAGNRALHEKRYVGYYLVEQSEGSVVDDLLMIECLQNAIVDSLTKSSVTDP